jgi:transcriptional regulator GlxA family with amidase domain
LLAATGLLDGRRATTHWLAAEELARRYPRIEVDPQVLYVDEGQVLTSAGAAAAFDLCLHMLRSDHGAAVAAHMARQTLLETTTHSVERIASACGFGSVTVLREHFRRWVLTSPQAYRASFRSRSPTDTKRARVSAFAASDLGVEVGGL